MSEQTAYFRVRFPDKGAGRTRYNGYVEGTDEADVRQRASEHGRLNQWNATKGKVTKTDLTRDELDDRLMDAANPNEAIQADGTVLIRDRDNQSVRETEP